MIDKLVEKYIDELNNHPAMKFANDAILLAAIRGGTDGYTGAEHLGHFLERTIRAVDANARLEVYELIHKKFMEATDVQTLNVLEELQKEIL